MEFDAYNRETGNNEPLILRGRVVDFADTSFYDRFLQEYGDDSKLDSPNAAGAV